jgi:CDP-4-dehydro-6-deoxyglucose reductase
MGHRVEILEPGAAFDAEDGETLLDAADRAGLHLPHDCRFGTCGTCRVRLAQGTVAYEDFPPGLSQEEAAAGFALACQARPRSDVVLMPERRLAPCSPPTRHRAKVLGVGALCDSVTHLRLELPPQAEGLIFRPGQYGNLFLPDGAARSFSLASAPQGRHVDFHLRRIPGGRFTQHRVSELAAGDEIEIELPLGTFCHHPEDYRPMILVATGTGIAPLKSIAESLMDEGDGPPVSLYWGMRTQDDLYLNDEVQTWASRFEDFRYVPVLSRPGAGWEGRRGYVQQAVIEDFPDLSEHAIYLCGSPGMVGQARTAFLAQGASIDHIYSDSFTFQSGENCI